MDEDDAHQHVNGEQDGGRQDEQAHDKEHAPDELEQRDHPGGQKWKRNPQVAEELHRSADATEELGATVRDEDQTDHDAQDHLTQAWIQGLLH